MPSAGSAAFRVRRSLQKELPNCSFDDEVVTHLAGSLDGDEPLSEETLLEEWLPFLQAASAVSDDDEARSVCKRLLIRLRSEDGSSTTASSADVATGVASISSQEDAIGKDLEKWLDQLRLSQYSQQAECWCQRMGAAHLSEVTDNWQDFAESLKLKPLERKRVEKYVAGEPPTRPQTTASPQPASQAGGTPSSNATRARHPGAQTIGPKEDPERYELLEEIGEGVTAKVFKCMRDGDVFAMKSISLARLRLQRDFNFVKSKLEREVSILFSLRSERIVALYDVVETDHALHLVMELVEGGDLFERIVQPPGCFSEATARYVFLQVVEGLRYIHSKNIVHRDLKPENILVDNKLSKPGLIEVKLSDFGHSKLINDGYSTGVTRVGTPQYWAPEVSDSRTAAQGYGKEVDLWSLGVVLYVMLVGTYPFDGIGSSIEAQMQKVQLSFNTPNGVNELSEQAKDLIYALIKPNPKERLTLEQCRNHPWVSVHGGSVAKVMRTQTQVRTDDKACEVSISLGSWKPDYQNCEYDKILVQRLRSDLVKFQKRWTCGASLKGEQVIADLSRATATSSSSGYSGGKGKNRRPTLSPADLKNATNELEELVRFYEREAQAVPPEQHHQERWHRGNIDAQQHSQRSKGSSSGKDGKAGPAGGGNKGSGGRGFKLVSATLKVDPNHGAGLDLVPERGGMKVEQVESYPGQPGLQKGDLIIKINEVALRGPEERVVEQIFRNNFYDGACLSVKRLT